MMDVHLEKLKKACEQLKNVEGYTNNCINVFNLVMPIIDSFNEVVSVNDSDINIKKTLSVIEDIKVYNSNLKGVVDAILDILSKTYKKGYARR